MQKRRSGVRYTRSIESVWRV